MTLNCNGQLWGTINSIMKGAIFKDDCYNGPIGGRNSQISG